MDRVFYICNVQFGYYIDKLVHSPDWDINITQYLFLHRESDTVGFSSFQTLHRGFNCKITVKNIEIMVLMNINKQFQKPPPI